MNERTTPAETREERYWRKQYEREHGHRDFIPIVELAVVILWVVAIFAALARCVFGA